MLNLCVKRRGKNFGFCFLRKIENVLDYVHFPLDLLVQEDDYIHDQIRS